MIRRIEITRRIVTCCLFSALLLILALPAGAQGYGGMYGGSNSSSGGSSSGSSARPTPTPYPTPTPTPTPLPRGELSLSATFLSSNSQTFEPTTQPEETLTIVVSLTAFGMVPGQYTLSALALDPRIGTLSPTRTSMSGSGEWRVHLQAGTEPGTFPVLIVAQDILGNHKADSLMIQVEIGVDPLLMAAGHPIRSTPNSAELRIRHRSWWDQINFRKLSNPNWFEYLCDDIYRSPTWQATINKATKIDRDRLNITKTMAPIQKYKSYTDIEPIMSRYWADGGIILSMATANRIGDVFAVWRTNTGMVVTTSESVAGAMSLRTTGIKVGNVLNGIGATMILLDFWSNMLAAETPTESREAWYKAEYSSLDLCLSTIIGNTFGSSVALPGMMVSYILTNSFDTLIGGHKRCWFKRMVVQAMDADLLSESIHDTAAVNKVKAAMLSSKGLKATLTDWWSTEAPTWAGKMGGCGNWDLAEARGYRAAFVDRLMRTHEVEIDGKRYHPWSFYYSVSRMLVLDRRREMAREAAEKMRQTEAAYISSLEQKTYLGTFKAVSSSNPQIPVRNATVCPTEWHNNAVGCEDGWTTGKDGSFTATVKGHLFSPQGTILLTIETGSTSHVFIVPQDAFEQVGR